MSCITPLSYDDCYAPSSIGNSKTFTAEENAYGPEKLAKMYECVDQYQKRIGKRLQKKKKTYKGLVEKVA